MNPARIAALRMGMGDAMPAFTVQINCGSGMQSIDTAYQYIREGHADLILAATSGPVSSRLRDFVPRSSSRSSGSSAG